MTNKGIAKLPCIWPADSLQSFFKDNFNIVVRNPEIFGICFDSRLVKPGDMFFALSGEHVDGHDYVHDAFDNGAVCAVVSRDVGANGYCIQVLDVFEAFLQLAAYRKSLLNCVSVAITGSVGKTTSKLGLVHFLRKAGRRAFCAPKNYNNMLGVAYLYNCVPLDIEFLIVEIGTNHHGEIAQLAQFVEPDYSLITHIGLCHTEFLGNLAGVMREKGELIRFTKKCVFFNEDFWYEFYFKKLARECGVEFEVFHNGAGFDSALNTLKNAWRAIFAKLGVVFVDDDEFGRAIEGRRNIFERDFNGASLTIIDSAYNANVNSMIDAIKFLKANFKGVRKVAILSDMREIGVRAGRYHQVLSCYLDGVLVLLVGEHMKYLAARVPGSVWFENNEMLQEYLERNVDFDAVILLKGSGQALVPVVRFFKGLC